MVKQGAVVEGFLKACRSRVAGQAFLTRRCLEIGQLLGELADPGDGAADSSCDIHSVPISTQRAALVTLLESYHLLPFPDVARFLVSYARKGGGELDEDSHSSCDDSDCPLGVGLLDRECAELVRKLCSAVVASAAGSTGGEFNIQKLDPTRVDAMQRCMPLEAAILRKLRDSGMRGEIDSINDIVLRLEDLNAMSSRLQELCDHETESLETSRGLKRSFENSPQDADEAAKRSAKRTRGHETDQDDKPSSPLTEYTQPIAGVDGVEDDTKQESRESSGGSNLMITSQEPSKQESLPEHLSPLLKEAIRGVEVCSSRESADGEAAIVKLVEGAIAAPEFRSKPFAITELVYREMGLMNSSDELFLHVCAAFVKEGTGLGACEGMLRGGLLPRIKGLKGHASRQMASFIKRVADERPEAVVNCLIVPLATMEGAENPQSELCVRLVKNSLPKNVLGKALEGICAVRDTEWSPVIIPVLTAIVNMSVSLDDAAVREFVHRLDVASLQQTPKLTDNIKFVTLIKTLLTKYERQSRAHCSQLRSVVTRCGTFMKKSCLAALDTWERHAG